MTILYHRSQKSNRESILRQGLIVNSDMKTSGFTQAGSWADEVYGNRPIYLAQRPWGQGSFNLEDFNEMDIYSVEIDSAVQLLPDLPSLIDHGGHVDDDGAGMWWEQGQEPKALQPYLDDDGWFDFDDAFNGAIPVEVFQRVTGTVAVADDIAVTNLELLDLQHDRSTPTAAVDIDHGQEHEL